MIINDVGKNSLENHIFLISCSGCCEFKMVLLKPIMIVEILDEGGCFSLLIKKACIPEQSNKSTIFSEVFGILSPLPWGRVFTPQLV